MGGGYSAFVREGAIHPYHVGASVNYWFQPRLAVRLELRDHVYPQNGTLHDLGFRFGVAFRSGMAGFRREAKTGYFSSFLIVDGIRNLSSVRFWLMVTVSAKISKIFSPLRSRRMVKGHWTPLPTSRYLE